MIRHWILDANHQLVEVDLLTWAHWLEHPDNRVIDYTQITSQITVSTIFLGIDHRFPGFPKGPPILFESLIMGGPLDGTMERYVSYDDAQTGHKMLVKKARKSIGQKVKTT